MPDRLKAVQTLTYAGHVYRSGEKFIASAPDAKTLVLIGKAARADEDDVEPPLAIETRDLVAVEPERKKRGRPPKGAYLRRDLRAKE